ncbi:dicarboxylate/amino acid:cation symporter [Tuwongella immobilis]|uniref:Dicarboxylate/amino acid:cation symporter n=1 Tax=Tuwongella immobilis TaxID=692036 RepID=A0A6C2YRH3_9BACT|nr:dicarboxylate/amino acid:cation symporter [Tuwongella immobilis]VIP04086.1 sodium:dicarboxylate symporter : Uncharacterized protein OS=candidate division ZIXI bacterium RBG-1 GN=RBG1_1C00001G0696 PE=4 SV=1: SDF [Tuwongella immobilis]VTS05539.1 sodium:dicarboxylate symporter : Uncharacterized protein OS=candidate division ZIXI bacterium RBG-1 GN=RBG1_1C00001G0696 PE=4 SV=1: SDF [Tuwongella immobilis]
MAETTSSENSLHIRVLGGLILGAIAGTIINSTFLTPVDGVKPPPPEWLVFIQKYITDPIGQVFLRLLLMTVVPLVFASLALGVARLGGMGSLGRIGLKTFAYFFLTMTAAVVIGLTLVNLVKPGVGLPPAIQTQMAEQFGGKLNDTLSKPTTFGIQTFIDIVPRNPLQSMVNMEMLSVIFFALLVGIGITRLKAEHNQLMQNFLESVGELMVFIIGLAMKFAPFGVFALIFNTTANFGLDLLKNLATYVIVVIVGLGIQMFVVFPILLSSLGKMNPLTFFKLTRPVILTAFSTSSSNATLPTSIRTAEQDLKIPAPIAGFVLPLGATMNMNGTALFEGVTAVFLAQVFGIELTLTQQIIVVVMCVLTAVGAAGVPGGSIPLLALVLTTVGVQPGAIAIILGVDRLLDMCRTTLNVLGDMTAAVYINQSEGAALSKSPTS